MIDWFSSETLARFSQPDAYPDDPSAQRGVSWIQTHLSHVFLSEARVYKLRKPVELEFVDFSTQALRNADCAREVALNRRLAPDVYLGAAPLLGDGERVWVGAIAPAEPLAREPREHFVVMRRLPEGRDALSLLEKGSLDAQQIERVAHCIARFHDHAGLGAPAPFSAADWYARCVDPVEASFHALAQSWRGDALLEPLAQLERAMRAFAERQAARLEQRRLAGRAVDGHGDLHLQHIWLEDGAADPIIIDCLEFSDRLRQIDAASEVAFTAMDLAYRGHAGLAERFLAVYARERDDFDLYGLVDYFIGYRALVRAKVAALASADVGIAAAQRARAAASARGHFELARALSAAPRAGALVVMAGVVGSGKSTVAEALAAASGGVVIASDRVRKALAGLSALVRSTAPPDEGLYAPDAVEHTYAAVLERAHAVVESGRVAILDATFSRRRHRELAAALAAQLGVECRIVEVRCAPEVALARLARRAAGGASASDAGPELYERSVARFEPIEASERAHVIHSDRDSWTDAVRDLARAAGLARGGTARVDFRTLAPPGERR